MEADSEKKAVFRIAVDGNPDVETMANALRVAIMEIVSRSRRGLEAMGCHPDRWDDDHFDGISRDMGYVKSLKCLLDGVERGIKEEEADGDR